MKDEKGYFFLSCDIVAWNGIIGEFGSIEHFTVEWDMVRKANECEIRLYKEKNPVS